MQCLENVSDQNICVIPALTGHLPHTPRVSNMYDSGLVDYQIIQP